MQGQGLSLGSQDSVTLEHGGGIQLALGQKCLYFSAVLQCRPGRALSVSFTLDDVCHGLQLTATLKHVHVWQ